AAVRPRHRLMLESLENRVVLDATPVPAIGILSGTAFVDSNNDGIRQGNEIAIPGLTLLLTGTDLNNKAVTDTVGTDATGKYQFVNVPVGNYQITSLNAGDLLNGKISVGNLGGTVFGNTIAQISIGAGQAGVNFDFGVRGLSSTGVNLRQLLSST